MEPKEEEPVVRLNDEYEDHSMSFFTKLLIGSAIFCVIAVGLGLYLFLNGANLISGNNINIFDSRAGVHTGRRAGDFLGKSDE